MWGESFRQTVILMAHHDEAGALGFVLNQPSTALLEDIAPPLADLPTDDGKLYIGGPVEPQIVTVLADFVEPAAVPSSPSQASASCRSRTHHG